MCKSKFCWLGAEIWFHRKGLSVSRGFWWVHFDMIPLTKVQFAANCCVPRKDKNFIKTIIYIHINIMKFP